MSTHGRNLHRLAGAAARREMEAFTGPCALKTCGEPSAGVIDTPLRGPKGICESHIPQAEQRGYSVRREPAFIWPKSMSAALDGDAGEVDGNE